MSRHGCHVNAWVGNTLQVILTIKPKILKVLDLNIDALRAYKAAVPDGFVIYRKYEPQQPLDSPLDDANHLADQVLADVAQYKGLVDALEGYNETGLWNDAPNYNAFTVQLAKRYHDAGFLFVAYDFSEENPDPSLWHIYIPGIQAADFLGLHEYSAPSMMDLAGTRCLRYRQVYNLLKPSCPNLRIIITETGIDGGVLGKTASGWMVFGDGAHYQQSVQWYAQNTDQDPYLFGFVLYCFGTADPQWHTFDGNNCPEVITYLASIQKEVPMNANPNGYPNAIWVPSPNYGYPDFTSGRNGNTIVGIVDHIAQGWKAALDSEFQTKGNPSAHYGVMQDGSIHQYVDEGNAAWTSGIDFTLGYNAYKSDLSVPWIKDCWDKPLSPNLVTIGIEHEGLSGVPMTEVQYQADLLLHEYLIRKYNITLDTNHVVGHYRLDNVNRPHCPGSAYPWSRLFTDLKGILNMSTFLGAPHGGPTNFSKSAGNQIGNYSQIIIYTFASNCIWATPDDGWKVHVGLPSAMSDAQVRAYAKDIWSRGGATFVDGQGITESWLQGLASLRNG